MGCAGAGPGAIWPPSTQTVSPKTRSTHLHQAMHKRKAPAQATRTCPLSGASESGASRHSMPAVGGERADRRPNARFPLHTPIALWKQLSYERHVEDSGHPGVPAATHGPHAAVCCMLRSAHFPLESGN